VGDILVIVAVVVVVVVIDGGFSVLDVDAMIEDEEEGVVASCLLMVVLNFEFFFRYGSNAASNFAVALDQVGLNSLLGGIILSLEEGEVL